MAVQDDRRELEICALLGLRRGEGRSEMDAFLDFEDSAGISRSCPIEIKSTTTGSIATARDVGLNHINKWRQQVWVFGFYDRSGTDLLRTLVLGPAEMESWISRIESYIAPDIAIGERMAEKLSLQDLHIICGEKNPYRRSDAESIMKKQWTKARYESEMDVDGGYSPAKMLEILKLRALYLNERGSTLNNPHIPKSFFSRFADGVLDLGALDARTLREKAQSPIRRAALQALL
ncbi:MAG: hypothetical protein OXD00_01365 [Gammaproteobacteria bacterium]|nr:hypothetical protein [Gammaproteobacteria bacterium]